MSRKPLVLAISFLLLAAIAIAVWLFTSNSGWLCCITNPANGNTICVQVKGLDSECTGGEIGWCNNISEDATGEADCLDK